MKSIAEMEILSGETVYFKNNGIPENITPQKHGIILIEGDTLNCEEICKEEIEAPSAAHTQATVKYDDLTDIGTFTFSQMTKDISVSLNVLGMANINVSRNSTFYVLAISRTKKIEKNIHGVGIYIVMTATSRKGKFDIKTPYDISAAAQLNFLKVDLNVKTFGLRPEVQKLFVPKQMSVIGVESAKYFDSVVENLEKLNNDNTCPEILPQMFIG